MSNAEDVLPQPQPARQEPPRTFKFLKPFILLAVALLIVLVAGTVGYLLGRQETGLPTQPKQLIKAPMFTQTSQTIVQPSPSSFIPASSVQVTTSANWKHIKIKSMDFK